MTRYIIMIVTALLLVSCNNNSIVDIPNKGTNKGLDNSAVTTKVYTKVLKSIPKVSNIPSECFDEHGLYQPNRGHDSLDCDNL